MKLPAPVLVVASSALLAAAAAMPVAETPPPPPPEPAVAPAPPAAPAPPTDYTTRMSEPPLVPEFDPATAPPPAPPETSPGGLRQCVGADGVPIFTDRRCSELGASDPPPVPAAFGATPGAPVRVRSCARNQDDLLAGVRAALESHDANRLADYYHWTGMDSATGYRLMERLDAFSARPVVDVQLVRDAPPPEEAFAEPFFESPPPPPPYAYGPGGEPLSSEPPRPRRPRRLASMIRVDQMRSETDVASTVTYFHLLTNAGCWWMRF